jgi:hypothetical protein
LEGSSVVNASTQEKRERKRCQKTLEVEFCTNDRTYRGVSDNFSISGLFIKTDNCLALHSAVSIKVHLPDGSISKLEGRVKRVQKVPYVIVTASEKTFKDGMGIEIIERDSSYVKFFMSLLSEGYK